MAKKEITLQGLNGNVDEMVLTTNDRIDSNLEECASMLFPQKGETTPRLRFKGFEGEWINTKLCQISKKVTTKNSDLKYRRTLTNSAEQGIVNQLDFFDHDISNGDNIRNYYVVEPDDFVYNPRISTTAPVGPINRNQLGYTGVMSPLYYVFKVDGIDKDFLSYYFKTSLWHKFMYDNGNSGARFDRFSISDEIFGQMPILHPQNIEEQKRIASFLKQIDVQIAVAQQKWERLKLIRQSCLNLLFPDNQAFTPPLRFKGFSGKWSRKMLGSIGMIYSGLTGKGKNDFGHGDARYITFLNVLNNAQIDSSLFEKVDIRNSETQNKVHKGDLLFNTSSETPEEVAMCAVVGEEFENLYLNSFCFGFKLVDENIDPLFLAYQMRSPYGRRLMSFIAQGATRYNLPKREFVKTKISIPTDIEEQHRIATFFSNLDKSILLQTQQVEKLCQLKKACLNKIIA